MTPDLNKYIDVPVEKWPKSLRLKAFSANADGMVNSGILKSSGKHFYKKWDYSGGRHSNPRYVIEGERDYGNNPRRGKSKYRARKGRKKYAKRKNPSARKLMASWVRKHKSRRYGR